MNWVALLLRDILTILVWNLTFGHMFKKKLCRMFEIFDIHLSAILTSDLTTLILWNFVANLQSETESESSEGS